MRVVPLVLVAVPLAACGGGGGKSPAATASPSAAIKAAAGKSALTSMHMTLRGSGMTAGVNVSIGGSGDFDNVRRLGSMNASFTGAGQAGAFDEIFSGTAFYMKSPLFASQLHGKTWIKLDLRRFGKALGIEQFLSFTPSQQLAQVQTITSGTDLGTEQIDGARTTHYRFHIDPSKLPQAKKLVALAHPRYGPEDVWIDDAGYVRRIHTQYSYAVGSSERQSFAMTMDFSKYGESVSVKVPPPAQVFDATNTAIKGLGG